MKSTRKFVPLHAEKNEKLPQEVEEAYEAETKVKGLFAEKLKAIFGETIDKNKVERQLLKVLKAIKESSFNKDSSEKANWEAYKKELDKIYLQSPLTSNEFSKSMLYFIEEIMGTQSVSLQKELSDLFLCNLTSTNDDRLNICGDNIGKYIFNKLQDLINTYKKENQGKDIALLYQNISASNLIQSLKLTNDLIHNPTIKNINNYYAVANSLEKSNKLLSRLMKHTALAAIDSAFESAQSKLHETISAQNKGEYGLDIADDVKETVQALLVQTKLIKRRLEEKAKHPLEYVNEKLKLIEILEAIQKVLANPTAENIQQYEKFLIEIAKSPLAKTLNHLLPNVVSPLARRFAEKEAQKELAENYKKEDITRSLNTIPDELYRRYEFIKSDSLPDKNQYKNYISPTYVLVKDSHYIHYYENGKLIRKINVNKEPLFKNIFGNNKNKTAIKVNDDLEKKAIKAYHRDRFGNQDLLSDCFMDAVACISDKELSEEPKNITSSETQSWSDFVYSQTVSILFDDKGDLRNDVAVLLPEDAKEIYSATSDIERNKLKYKTLSNVIVNLVLAPTTSAIEDLFFKNVEALGLDIARYETCRSNYFLIAKSAGYLAQDAINKGIPLLDFANACNQRLQAVAKDPHFKAKGLQQQIQQSDSVFRKSFTDAKEKLKRMAKQSYDGHVRATSKIILANVDRIRRTNPHIPLATLLEVLKLTEALMLSPSSDNIDAYRHLAKKIVAVDNKLSMSMVNICNVMVTYGEKLPYHQIKTEQGKFLSKLKNKEKENLVSDIQPVAKKDLTAILNESNFFVNDVSFSKNKIWYQNQHNQKLLDLQKKKEMEEVLKEGKMEEAQKEEIEEEEEVAQEEAILSPEMDFIAAELFKNDKNAYDKNIEKLNSALAKFDFTLPPFLTNCKANHIDKFSYDELGNIYLDVLHTNIKRNGKEAPGTVMSRYKLTDVGFELIQMKISNHLIEKLMEHPQYELKEKDIKNAVKQEHHLLTEAINRCDSHELIKLGTQFKNQFDLSANTDKSISTETLGLVRQLIEDPSNGPVRVALTTKKSVEDNVGTEEFKIINQLIAESQIENIKKTSTNGETISPLVRRTLTSAGEFDALSWEINQANFSNKLDGIFSHFIVSPRIQKLLTHYKELDNEEKFKNWMELALPIVLDELFDSDGSIRKDVYDLLNQNHLLDRLIAEKSENAIKVELVKSYLLSFAWNIHRDNVDLKQQSNDFVNNLKGYLIAKGFNLKGIKSSADIIIDKNYLNNQNKTFKNHINQFQDALFPDILFDEKLRDLKSTVNETNVTWIKEIELLINPLIRIALDLKEKGDEQETYNARAIIFYINELIAQLIKQQNGDKFIYSQLEDFNKHIEKLESSYGKRFTQPFIKFLDYAVELAFEQSEQNFENLLTRKLIKINLLAESPQSKEYKPSKIQFNEQVEIITPKDSSFDKGKNKKEKRERVGDAKMWVDITEVKENVKDVKGQVAIAKTDLDAHNQSTESITQKLILLQALESTMNIYDQTLNFNLNLPFSQAKTTNVLANKIIDPAEINKSIEGYEKVTEKVGVTFRSFTWKERFTNAMSSFANSIKKTVNRILNPETENVESQDNIAFANGQNVFFKNVAKSMGSLKEKISSKKQEIETEKEKENNPKNV